MAAVDRFESVSELAARVADSPELQQQIAANPAAALQEMAKPLESDAWIYRLVVIVLGLTILTVIGGVIALKAINEELGIPDALVAIGSAAVAALAGLLTPFPGRR